MKKPGTDLSDPKTYSAAKGVATRKNNAFVKKVRATLPLYEAEVMQDFVPSTPEGVIEKRKVQQEDHARWSKEQRLRERANIREYRATARKLCVDEAEFFELARRSIKSFYGPRKSVRWYLTVSKLKKRLEPLSEQEDMILAWIEQTDRPVTHWELWRRGDGLSLGELVKILNDLEYREILQHDGWKDEITDKGLTINVPTLVIKPSAFAMRLGEKTI